MKMFKFIVCLGVLTLLVAKQDAVATDKASAKKAPLKYKNINPNNRLPQQAEEFSEWSPEEIANSNCRIRIIQSRKSGLTDYDYVFAKATSEEDCKAKASIYKINFSPEFIKSVEVEVQWLGRSL